jgi:hypothetical protein
MSAMPSRLHKCRRCSAPRWTRACSMECHQPMRSRLSVVKCLLLEEALSNCSSSLQKAVSLFPLPWKNPVASMHVSQWSHCSCHTMETSLPMCTLEFSLAALLNWQYDLTSCINIHPRAFVQTSPEPTPITPILGMQPPSSHEYDHVSH